MFARAGHPFELADSTTSHLVVDAAQHGLGSRARGPDVWPEFALRPETDQAAHRGGMTRKTLAVSAGLAADAP
ncbi:beta-galactosidase small subunit [Streptomyces sp. M41(2017)]|uniref:beta-galactosidase small subunit n=1 Tax=Streptomyces sp. M41(2017) TaxID=1955065 RepID=UPI001F4EC6A7|nr:beta-galactosidase small subunit [Streptomyces sp. M41(2017)]